MEFPLDGVRPRRFLLAASLAVAALLAFQASKVWIANNRIHSEDLATIKRGAYLLPGNGEAWDRVGRFEEYNFSNSDPESAIAAFQRALKDDPNSSYYWIDLGGAYELAGNNAEARRAYERARNVYPLSAFVAWSYGNFLLRQRAYNEAYAEIQWSVRVDPSLLPLAISRVWRSNEDVNQLLNQVLPADTRAYFQALDFFESIHDAEAGLAVWQRLIALKKPFVLKASFPFLDQLISENRTDDARRVWHQALAASGTSGEDPADHSEIWDGNFKHDFPNGGLGWRWQPLLGVSIDFDSAPPSVAGRSIRIDFGGGTNPQLDEPAEFVPVEPDRTYRFHAEMKTSGITTENGVRFLLSDLLNSNVVIASTESFTGTHEWTSLDADAKTGPDTYFLNVRLARNPSRLFDNKLSGTVWIADISLVPSDSGGAQAPR